MRGKLILTAFGAAIAAAPLQTARADTNILSGDGCGGTPFTMCASWSLVLISGNTYRLDVTNQAGQTGYTDASAPTSYFTQFGFGQSTNPDLTFALASCMGCTTSSGWGVVADPSGDPFNGAGMDGYFVFNANTTNGINGATAPGATTTIYFTVTGSGFAPEQIGIHAQGGPNQCSAKAVFGGNADYTGTLNGEVNFTSTDCGGTTVPEPATMALVGTGLAGILAARRRRRVTKG